MKIVLILDPKIDSVKADAYISEMWERGNEQAVQQKKVHLEKGKITGGRQKEKLLLERIVQETISGKDNGIQHVSYKEALQGKFSSHFSAQLSYLPLKLIQNRPSLATTIFPQLGNPNHTQ